MTTPVTTTKLPYNPSAKTKKIVPTRTPFRDNVMDETDETEQVRRIPDTTTIQPLFLLLQQFVQQPQQI
jgi:hypothetical protein